MILLYSTRVLDTLLLLYPALTHHVYDITIISLLLDPLRRTASGPDTASGPSCQVYKNAQAVITLRAMTAPVCWMTSRQICSYLAFQQGASLQAARMRTGVHVDGNMQHASVNSFHRYRYCCCSCYCYYCPTQPVPPGLITVHRGGPAPGSRCSCVPALGQLYHSLKLIHRRKRGGLTA